MQSHHLLALAATLAVPLAVGAGIFIAARRGDVPLWATCVIAPVGMVLSLVLTGMLAGQCASSRDMLLAAQKRLTPQERATLQGSQWVCPGVYYFQRDGRRECLVPGGDGDVYVGCG